MRLIIDEILQLAILNSKLFIFQTSATNISKYLTNCDFQTKNMACEFLISSRFLTQQRLKRSFGVVLLRSNNATVRGGVRKDSFSL